MKGLGVLLLAILAAAPVIILLWLVEADGKADEAARERAFLAAWPAPRC
jgi:hypothetical protein